MGGHGRSGDLHPLQIYPSPCDIQINETKGFVLLSRQPPTPVQFYAQGFDTLPAAEVSSDAEDYPTLFTVGVTGITLGPDANDLDDVQPVPAGPDKTDLFVVAPNPSAGKVTVTFSLSKPSRVELGIYDVGGRKIRALMRGRLAPGMLAVSWDGYDDAGAVVGPGVYFARLAVDGKGSGQRRLIVRR